VEDRRRLVIETVVDGPFGLAEGPLWDARQDALIWVDIYAGVVVRHWPKEGNTERIELGEHVGCVALTAEPDVLVAALRSGWHWLDLKTIELRLIAAPESDRPKCRFNDGAVDHLGRFWTGTLEDGEENPAGRLYRLSRDYGVETMDEGFLCSNGIGWSPDNQWMFFVDSRRDAIFRYESDATGKIGSRQKFIDTSLLEGIPDGICVDADGLLWCAFWDGAAVRAFDMHGAVVDVIDVPALRPTSLTFGGPDLKTMYITTASLGLTPEQKKKWPASGAVLALPAARPGRAENIFGSSKSVSV
jgi:sugar lactone lactonase YvrE